MKGISVVAGAGIWGCTLARRLVEAGRKVLVLEKREAVGGNCRGSIDSETSIEVHVYGSHIFHTKNEKVWSFVRRFSEFNDYRHFVLANYRGKIYHLPFGCTLLREFFGREIKPSELCETDKKAIFDAFIRGYTSKQWGVSPEMVDPAVIARLKVRDTYSIDYFDDPHQGIPLEGYNKMFERMLDHPDIEVKCNTEFKLNVLQDSFDCPIYYSGPIDALFNYKFGALPWRSLRFETEKMQIADYQRATVVNYSEASVPYTRIHEFKHYHPESHGGVNPSIEQLSNLNNQTIIMREFSKGWELGDEPYYPISNPESVALLKRYRDEAAKINNLVVGGRLGGYKYYDMDQAVAAALEVEI